MNFLNYLVTAILAAAAIYAFYIGSKRYTDYKKGAKKFQERFSDARVYTKGMWLIYFEAVMGVFCLVLVIILPQSASTIADAWQTRILYLSLALLIFAMMFDTYVSRHILFSKDGFYADLQYVKYRSILKIEESTGRFKPLVLNITNNVQLSLPAGMNAEFVSAYNTWKQEKKAANKRGKKR
jgi:hypothetical protein